jgi:hypothetical protein
MIEELTIRKQTPTAPNEWLYEEVEGKSNFVKSVYLGKHAEPWAECTNEEKVQWEKAHKLEEPIEPEQ